MKKTSNLRWRYWRIMAFAIRYILKVWWFDIALPRIGLRKLSARGRTARFVGIARAFRGLASDLGGLMIKVGQFMSTRMDVLPHEITDELASLQDEVSPVEFESIRELVESEFGVGLDEVFSSFDPVPVASASLGQVHRATLLPLDARETGLNNTMVKVLRPGIGEVVEVDLSALRRIAGWLSHVRFISRRTDLPAVVEEFAHTCHEEIDYSHEARSANRFHENFAENPRVNSPEIVWERSTRRVLTLEDVSAIKISDTTAVRAAGIDPGQVAQEFARAMFDQYFRHGFFHADPHPGNLYVTPEAGPRGHGTSVNEDLDGGSNGTRDETRDKTSSWHLTFIDFGMMGAVPKDLRSNLQTLILAVTTRDGRAMVAAMESMGVLLPSADTGMLARAMTELFERFGGMEIADLQNVDPQEFSDFAEKFGDVMREMPFQLPENFLLLFRSISLTSGLCSALDPQFDIWKALQPYIQDLARGEGGDVVRQLGERAVSTLRQAAGLPSRLDRLAEAAESGDLAVRAPRTERELRRIERGVRRIVAAVIFAALFLGGILLRWTDPGWGNALLGFSALPFLMAVLGSRRPRPPHGRRGAGGSGRPPSRRTR